MHNVAFSEQANTPLKGIKVIELSTMVTAALATTMLSEQGAHVTKIEPRGLGDPLRYLGSMRKGVSSIFVNCNRGKESIALDLKAPEGLDIVKALVKGADVLISNYRPGVLDRLGLSRDVLRDLNEGLVYLSISGFGTEGPLIDAPAYDHAIQAISGFTEMQSDERGPQFVKTFICDEVTAYTACQAITSALYFRAMTGKGQDIDLSMLESCLYFSWPGLMVNDTFIGEGVTPGPSLKSFYKAYRTSDGFIAMAPFNDRHWGQLFEATGKADLKSDERFCSIERRGENFDHLTAIYDSVFSEMTTEEVLTLLSAIDIPSAECLSIDKILTYPQVKAIGIVKELSHPVLGDVRYPAHPARFDRQGADKKDPVGLLGADTSAVLRSLDYSEEDIDRLYERGVIECQALEAES